MDDARQNVTVKFFESGSLYGIEAPSGLLKDAIKWFSEKLEEVPEEYRDAATVRITGEDDGYGASWTEINIEYSRPETDAEMAARIYSAKSRQARQEEQERAAYEMLKAKFG